MGGGAIAAAQALSLLFSAAFLTYWAGILVCYLRRRPAEPGRSEDFAWHLLVPCLDEAAVIGDTLAYLRATFPAAQVWVLDDNSTDATAAIVAAVAAHDPAVHLLRRRPPDAQVGKGPALNAGYRALLAHLGPAVDPARVIVGVVDADGRPSPNCLDACAGPAYFGAAEVGGVQVEVRIMNRVDRRPLPERGRARNLFARTLVRMQDLEFRSVIGAIQESRGLTRTVGMGGNGQFTRLSALQALDEGDGRAWRGSLLEDYELGLHLMLAGQRTAFCAEAWVDQEGLPDLHRYFRQRTRWGQGVMQCLRYLPKAWNSPNLTTAGALETSYYLLQPWLSLLGTIVFPLPLIAMLVNQAHAGVSLWAFLAGGGWVMAAMYLVLGTTPFWLWGPLYRRRCEPQAGRLAALGWGFAYLLYVYGFYVTSWRAVVRIVRGQHAWAKTRRNAEFQGQPDAPGLVPAPVPVPGALPLLVPAGAPLLSNLVARPGLGVPRGVSVARPGHLGRPGFRPITLPPPARQRPGPWLVPVRHARVARRHLSHGPARSARRGRSAHLTTSRTGLTDRAPRPTRARLQRRAPAACARPPPSSWHGSRSPPHRTRTAQRVIRHPHEQRTAIQPCPGANAWDSGWWAGVSTRPVRAPPA